MKLSTLLAGLPNAQREGTDVEITGICADSRAVTPGALFVAVPGYASDGHRYLADALRRGAAALLLQRDHVDASALPAAPLAIVDDTRAALATVEPRSTGSRPSACG